MVMVCGWRFEFRFVSNEGSKDRWIDPSLV